MTIADVVNQLKYGELQSIAAKDDNIAITSYINLAVVALYGEFNLKSSEVLIDLLDNVTEYQLPDDVMNITAVYNEIGVELPLDDETNILSVYQPSYDTLQHPYPVTGNTISVIYAVAPVFLIYVDTASLTLRVPIPPQLLEPLLHYIGYRAHGAMNGEIKAENNTHYIRYIASVKRIKDLGLVKNHIAPAGVNKAEAIDEDEIDYTVINDETQS